MKMFLVEDGANWTDALYDQNWNLVDKAVYPDMSSWLNSERHEGGLLEEYGLIILVRMDLSMVPERIYDVYGDPMFYELARE